MKNIIFDVGDVLLDGSLTLCFPLDFHNPLQHSPLRLIFLSNFLILYVLFCAICIIMKLYIKFHPTRRYHLTCM